MNPRLPELFRDGTVRSNNVVRGLFTLKSSRDPNVENQIKPISED